VAVALARELVTAVRRLDEYELRQLLLLVRGLLVAVDGHPDPARERDLPASLRYRQEHVRCGRDSCTTCPHGPYWYAYWREDGRTRKRYVGRHLPGEPLEPVVPDLPPRVGATTDQVRTRAARPTGTATDGAD
jgi:hypothetical protein